MGDYRDLFNASIKDPAEFWAQAARAVSWIREPRRVLDDSNPPFFRWFPDGELNTCANALDRHVADGHAEQAALTSIHGGVESAFPVKPLEAGL